MEKIEKISIEDFMSMFIAVGYLQEQRLFNIESLKNYLRIFYAVDDNIVNQIDFIAQKMEEAEMITKVDQYSGLYRISSNIPFERIISSNYEYADGMRNFFYNYINSSIPGVTLISDENETVVKQKK